VCVRLAGQRALVCYITVTLMTLVERPSSRSRIKVKYVVVITALRVDSKVTRDFGTVVVHVGVSSRKIFTLICTFLSLLLEVICIIRTTFQSADDTKAIPAGPVQIKTQLRGFSQTALPVFGRRGLAFEARCHASRRNTSSDRNERVRHGSVFVKKNCVRSLRICI